MKAAAFALSLAAAVALPAAAQDVVHIIEDARLIEPTDRYGHKVLGAEGEYAAMEITLRAEKDGALWSNTTTRLALPESLVFEDVDADPARPGVQARLANVIGDARPEIVVVESSVDAGARLAIYGPNRQGFITTYFATPPIGRRNRWLAVAGIADFDGDGLDDVAWVETPHIGGKLHILSVKGTRVVPLATPVAGVSNHRIGEDFISGGVRDCGDGPELVLADAQWTQLLSARIVEGAWVLEPIASSVRPEDWSKALACED